MSAAGRGRGYGGRHQAREPRPGDETQTTTEDLEAARTLAELSPRSPVSDTSKPENKRMDPPKVESDAEGQFTRLQQEDEAVMKELLYIDEQYKPLLVQLDQFSAGEDGIQFNRKLRHFETTISSMCPDEPRLLQAFASLRAHGLRAGAAARRLAAVGASFTRQQRQHSLRTALLNVVMQGTFAKLDVLERANPQYLINASNLIGDYFAEARLCNGNKVHILAAPLLQYMKALLASDDIRAHRSLATQLMQNGRELLSVLSQELDELSISIRKRLLTPPPVSIVWLLLSADLCLNKFLPLPNTLQQFYASHLDLNHDDSFSEVDYGSWKESPKKLDETDVSLAERVSQNISQLNLSQEENGMKPKLRPILGAGAGLLRQEQNVPSTASQDNFDTWTGKSLTKRYDLNSWRQNGDETEEPVFNPTVLPPNYDYPPPTVANSSRFNYPETYPNYLQQGDGPYIQNQYHEASNTNFNQQQSETFNQYSERGTEKTSKVERQTERPVTGSMEKVNCELQKSSARKPVENWRKDKPEIDANKNRKSWTRQRSKDNVNDEEEVKKEELRKSARDIRGRTCRRDSTEEKKRSMEAPRSHKYWDHDDRCDIDYNS